MFYLNSRLRSLFCGCQCFLFNFYKFTDLFLCEKWRLNSRLNHSDIGTSSCSLSTDSGRCFQFRSTPIWRYLSSFKVATRPHFLFNAGRWSSLQGKSLPRRDLVWNICIKRHLFGQLYEVLWRCNTLRLQLLKLELKLLILQH